MCLQYLISSDGSMANLRFVCFFSPIIAFLWKNIFRHCIDVVGTNDNNDDDDDYVFSIIYTHSFNKRYNYLLFLD